MNLHRIRNIHAVQRIARSVPKPRPLQRWPMLTEPVMPLDTLARSRAQSLLAGIQYRDGSTNPGPLSLPQAQDVLRWANTV